MEPAQIELTALLDHDLGPALFARFCRPAPAWLEIVAVPDVSAPEAVFALARASVLFHVLAPVTPPRLASMPKLRLVQKIGTGTNTIDRDATRARGIRVANMPGTNSQAVCEHTLALMLATLRGIADLHASTAAGRGWQLHPDTYRHSGELAGRTVGFVGFGEVPRRLAPVVRALGGQTVYALSKRPHDALAKLRALDELLEEADIVSLHVPLTPATVHLIDATRIARMKRGAILINTARGGLVDTSALVAALREERLAGAGLDVLDVEPVELGHPLAACPRVVLTPHIGWLTSETIDRSAAAAVENCRRLRAGEPLLNELVAELS
jgi:phosphoglycerate dehydrogenase-like enzyme